MGSNFEFFLEDKIVKIKADKVFLDYNHPFVDNLINKF
jgi:FKBP-type peptidyl-prolyl cis-trans isomerase 2